MPFATINPSNPRTNPWNFHKKYWELAELENEFFLSRPFWFWFWFWFSFFLLPPFSMGRNFDDYPDFQQKAGEYKIIRHTVLFMFFVIGQIIWISYLWPEFLKSSTQIYKFSPRRKKKRMSIKFCSTSSLRSLIKDLMIFVLLIFNALLIHNLKFKYKRKKIFSVKSKVNHADHYVEIEIGVPQFFSLSGQTAWHNRAGGTRWRGTCQCMTCDVRSQVVSCDMRVQTHFGETCDVRACGAFLHVWSGIAILQLS